MNEEIIQFVLRQNSKRNLRFGTLSICFTYHDGQIRKWDVVTTESHNVQQQAKTKGEEV